MSGFFNVRALEIHGNKMWDLGHVQGAVEFMRRYQLTALIFHSSDLIHTITYPRRYFGHLSTWKDSPPRRGENAILNNRAYVDSISRLCSRESLRFFLEVKELTFPDEMIEVWPDLIRDGVVCPTDPRWSQFLEDKYVELFSDFPYVSGLIVSIGSPEGRATMAARRCKCDRCARTRLSDWHRDMTAPIARAAKAYGRKLVVREFSYKPEDQNAVMESLAQLPQEVDLMVKPYPHDFYPTFPHNPALDAFPGRRKWLEYDVHGQYYGWGLIPCVIAEDIAERFRHAAAKGVTAVSLRTDWERVNDLSCLDTFGRVNLAVASLQARDLAADAHELVARSLLREGYVDAGSFERSELDGVTELLMEVWPAVSKALYVQGFVLNSSSMFPAGIRHAWWTMMTSHSLDVWAPEAADRVDVGVDDRVRNMLAEKEQALVAVRQITARLERFLHSGFLRLPDLGGRTLPPWLLERYVEGFVLCGIVVILARAAVESSGAKRSVLQDELRQAIAELTTYNRWLRSWTNDSEYAHHLHLLMDYQRIETVLEEAQLVANEEVGESQSWWT